jgi:hypothetical protein
MGADSLTVSSTLQCPHGGSVSISSANTAAKADGGAIALATDTFSISGCPNQFITGASSTPDPCTTVQWVVTDMMVKVNGTPTLSKSSSSLVLSSMGIPQGSLSVANAQSKVQTS